MTGQQSTRGHNAKWDLSGDQSAIVDRSHPSRISQQLQGSHKVQKSDCHLVIISLEKRNVICEQCFSWLHYMNKLNPNNNFQFTTAADADW